MYVSSSSCTDSVDNSTIDGGRVAGFILFPYVLMPCGIQTALSRI